LGEQLGVSRAMVREAVKLLTARGLVRTRRGSGIYVESGEYLGTTATIDLSMPVDPEHILALFEFRCLQETLTARLATERITHLEVHALEGAIERNRLGATTSQWELFVESDIDFHKGVAQAAHNSFLAETVEATFRLQRWAIRLATEGAPGSLLKSAEQHTEILNAIKSGDPEAAARAMQTHVQTVIIDYQTEVRRLLTGQGNSLYT
jgi:DNA-binding FadR family transcriptional regulator